MILTGPDARAAILAAARVVVAGDRAPIRRLKSKLSLRTLLSLLRVRDRRERDRAGYENAPASRPWGSDEIPLRERLTSCLLAVPNAPPLPHGSGRVPTFRGRDGIGRL